jgi:hypothetical protein
VRQSIHNEFNRTNPWNNCFVPADPPEWIVLAVTIGSEVLVRAGTEVGTALVLKNEQKPVSVFHIPEQDNGKVKRTGTVTGTVATSDGQNHGY